MTTQSLDDQIIYILEKYDVDDTTELKIQHLAHIRAALVKASANWYNIGVCLGVDTNLLDGFKRQFRNDCDRCLSSTIDAWLKLIKPSIKHTWKDVVIAMGSSTAGQNPAEAEIIAGGDFTQAMIRDSELSSLNVSTQPLIDNPENQKAVQAALTPVENKWMEVGIFLGLKMSGLQNAIHEEDDKIAYITKTFLKKDYMVTIYGEPTWKRIVGAIGAMAGGDNRRHAMEIAGQHPATEEHDGENQRSAAGLREAIPIIETDSDESDMEAVC